MRSRLGFSWYTFSRKVAVRLGLPLLAMCAAGTSHAQSSVTLYGIIDTGVEYVTNIGPQKSAGVHVPSNTASLPSRWGVRGVEDLGGGLSAIFVLESGFAPGTGALNQGGREFGRQAYVGLSGRWGTFSVGRQYSQIFYGLPGDTLAPNLFSAAVLDTYLAGPRVDNALVYTFTNSGFTFGVTYSLGRDAVDSPAAGGCVGQSPNDWRACKSISAMAKYDGTNWGVATVFDRNYGGGGVGSPLPTSSLTDTRSLINAYMKFGPSTIGAGFVHRVNHGAETATISDVSSNYWWLGGTYWIGPAFALDTQFGHITLTSNTPSGASVIAARATYLLSKSTSVYFSAGRVFNQRDAAYTIDGGVTTGSSPLPGVDQTGVFVGIRHLF